MTRTMYDSINPAAIPANAQMAAGYVGGRWPTYANGTLRAHCPNAILVSIAVNATEDAMVLDVERGDAEPADSPAWCERQAHRGQVPTVYCSTSLWPSVQAGHHLAGVPIPQWWEAHYDNNPVLSPGSVAKQYRSDSIQNLDYSVVADHWPGVDPQPQPTRKPLMDREGLISFLANVICARDASADELTQFADPAKTTDREVILHFEDDPDGTALKLFRRSQAGLH